MPFMGVTKLRKIIPVEQIALSNLRNKRIAIDAYNHLYQFLSIIRQRDGTPLMDAKGNITSHLSGLFYRTINLLTSGIRPIYVFDGKPSKLKAQVINERKKKREEAKRKWDEAIAEGDYAGARKYAQAALFLSKEMVDESKNLLTAMGVPNVQAASEGEAQAAFLVQQGDAWASGSQDWDSILFGSPRFVRNLNFTGRRKIPRKNEFVEIQPELIRAKQVFSELKLTREELVDVGIMLGTDFNEGFPKVGPVTALKYIREFKNLETIIKEKGFKIDFPIDEIRAIFLSPTIERDYMIKFKRPNDEKIKKIMCDAHDFSLERVENALKKYLQYIKERKDAKKQRSLSKFM